MWGWKLTNPAEFERRLNAVRQGRFQDKKLKKRIIMGLFAQRAAEARREEAEQIAIYKAMGNPVRRQWTKEIRDDTLNYYAGLGKKIRDDDFDILKQNEFSKALSKEHGYLVVDDRIPGKDFDSAVKKWNVKEGIARRALLDRFRDDGYVPLKERKSSKDWFPKQHLAAIKRREEARKRRELKLKAALYLSKIGERKEEALRRLRRWRMKHGINK